MTWLHDSIIYAKALNQTHIHTYTHTYLNIKSRKRWREREIERGKEF